MSDGWGNAATTGAAGDWGVHDTNDAPSTNTNDDTHDSPEVKPKPAPLPFERRKAPIAEWEKKKAYDYTELAAGTGEWAGNAAVYQWDGETGDVGPEDRELENILFGKEDERGANEVIDFSK